MKCVPFKSCPLHETLSLKLQSNHPQNCLLLHTLQKRYQWVCLAPPFLNEEGSLESFILNKSPNEVHSGELFRWGTRQQNLKNYPGEREAAKSLVKRERQIPFHVFKVVLLPK